jgi:hypothetical protein
VIKSLTAENIPPTDSNCQMKVVYGSNYVNISTMLEESVCSANLGQANLNDKHGSERPQTAPGKYRRNYKSITNFINKQNQTKLTFHVSAGTKT